MTSFKRRKILDDTTSWDEIMAAGEERVSEREDEDEIKKGD
jgi:hypothetical protein